MTSTHGGQGLNRGMEGFREDAVGIVVLYGAEYCIMYVLGRESAGRMYMRVPHLQLRAAKGITVQLPGSLTRMHGIARVRVIWLICPRRPVSVPVDGKMGDH